MNNRPQLIEMMTDVVSSYVASNPVPAEELPALCRRVFGVLEDLANGAVAVPPPEPAVPIKKSVTPDFIICLEDGKQFKSLRRHLRSEYNLSPEEYRAKWGLPVDYPMVAPNYARQRSELAKRMGLGRKSEGSAAAMAAPEPAIQAEETPAGAAPKKRGRPKKS